MTLPVKQGDLITADTLKELDSCWETVDRFGQEYPDGVRLTDANFRRMYAEDYNVLWLANHPEVSYTYTGVLETASTYYGTSESIFVYEGIPGWACEYALTGLYRQKTYGYGATELYFTNTDDQIQVVHLLDGRVVGVEFDSCRDPDEGPWKITKTHSGDVFAKWDNNVTGLITRAVITDCNNDSQAFDHACRDVDVTDGHRKQVEATLALAAEYAKLRLDSSIPAEDNKLTL